MKRAILIGAAVVAGAGVAAMGAAYGPDLLAYHHFQKALDRFDADNEANGGPWPQVQYACINCHGPRGQAKNAQYASLAGQPAPYLEAQLHAFAEGRRRNSQMSPLAANLRDDQIKQLAGYFARQTPERNEAASEDAALERHGQALITAKDCASCHGERLMGSPIAPRLAGQGELYLVDQLSAFKRGARQDPTQAMNGMAAALSEEEIKAAAHHLAGLSPAPASGGQASAKRTEEALKP